MTTNPLEVNDLMEAIISVYDVLKYVNNSMYNLSIQGFDVCCNLPCMMWSRCWTVYGLNPTSIFLFVDTASSTL